MTDWKFNIGDIRTWNGHGEQVEDWHDAEALNAA